MKGPLTRRYLPSGKASLPTPDTRKPPDSSSLFRPLLTAQDLLGEAALRPQQPGAQQKQEGSAPAPGKEHDGDGLRPHSGSLFWREKSNES